MKAICKLLVIAIITVSTKTYGIGGGITGFASEVTQIGNNIELIGIYSQEVKNIQEQIKQYETMLKNLKDIDDFNALKAIIQNDLETLANIVQQGNALAYSNSNIDEKFRDTYKGYDFFKLSGEDAPDYEALGDIYQNWSSTNHDSILGALKAANYQASQFESESNTIEAIQHSLDSAEGALQALQAAGAIAAQQATQLQKLRELTMAQMQMQANYIATQTDRRAKADANKQNALRRTTPLIDTPVTRSTANDIW